MRFRLSPPGLRKGMCPLKCIHWHLHSPSLCRCVIHHRRHCSLTTERVPCTSESGNCFCTSVCKFCCYCLDLVKAFSLYQPCPGCSERLSFKLMALRIVFHSFLSMCTLGTTWAFRNEEIVSRFARLTSFLLFTHSLSSNR